jgi:hypothetical protein
MPTSATTIAAMGKIDVSPPVNATTATKNKSKAPDQ